MSEELEKLAWDEACRIFHDTANNHHVWGSIATAPEDWQYNLKLEYANAIVAAHKSSQARLSEAVKVLEPFLNVRDQHPESVKLINGNMDSFTVMAVHVTKGQFLAAKAFLATLGEEA